MSSSMGRAAFSLGSNQGWTSGGGNCANLLSFSWSNSPSSPDAQEFQKSQRFPTRGKVCRDCWPSIHGAKFEYTSDGNQTPGTETRLLARSGDWSRRGEALA